MKNEGELTTKVEGITRRIPSIGFLELAVGSMALSAGLMLAGHRTWGNFVGQWAPTLLILGTYNKLVKTFSAPYDEEQRQQHGGHPSPLKLNPDLQAQPHVS